MISGCRSKGNAAQGFCILLIPRLSWAGFLCKSGQHQLCSPKSTPGWAGALGLCSFAFLLLWNVTRISGSRCAARQVQSTKQPKITISDSNRFPFADQPPVAVWEFCGTDPGTDFAVNSDLVQSVGDFASKCLSWTPTLDLKIFSWSEQPWLCCPSPPLLQAQTGALIKAEPELWWDQDEHRKVGKAPTRLKLTIYWVWKSLHTKPGSYKALTRIMLVFPEHGSASLS